MTARASITASFARSIVRNALAGSVAAMLALTGCDQPAAPRNDPVPVTVQSVRITGAEWLVEQSSASYAAIVTGTDGHPLTRDVAWTSSDSTIAIVTGGVVYAARAGEVTLTAAAGGKVAFMRVVVRPLTVETVRVSPVTDLFAGESRIAGASLYAADGRLMEGRAITWVSLDPAIATVDIEGRVHGVSPGTTDLVATSEGRTGSVRIIVKPSRANGRWTVTGTALRNANTVCSITDFYIQLSQAGTSLTGEQFYDMWTGQGPSVTCTAIVGQPGPYTTPATPAGPFTGSIADNGYAVLTSANGWQLVGMLDRATGSWSGTLRYVERESVNGIVSMRTGSFTATRR